MGTQPGAEPTELAKLSDKELIERYCSEPRDTDAFDELWKRHQQRIEKFAAYFKRYCPSSYSPGIFAEEVVSRTQAKMAQKLCKYEGRATFSTWLYRIAARNAIDVRREITGHDPGQLRETVCFDSLTEAELVKTYGVFRDKVKEDPFHRAAAAERKEILRSILLGYASSQEGYDSFRAVLLHAIQECTIAEIARRFFTYHRKINEMLAHDYLALRTSLAEAGITGVQDLIT